MKTHQLFAVACASAMLLVSASAFADLTDDERRCSDAFNKAVRNVGNQEQKANRKCVKDGSGDVSACVNLISAKALDKELKIEGLFLVGERCDPNAAFGVNSGAGGDDAGKAAEEGTDDIIRGIWGDPPDGVVLDSKCADAVAKRTGKIYDTILRAFRKCAMDGATIANIGTLEACVGTAIADAKVTTFAGKLSQDVANKCFTLPEPGTEDGECGGEGTAAGYSGCASRVAKCNACLAINATTTSDADCDALDNGSVDGSCGGAPVHKCTFDEATDNSDFQLFAGGNVDLSALVTDIAGAVDITCDPATQDVNGKRVCTCELQTWTPPQITGLGFICVDPGPPCPTGEVDCDGGNALGLEAEDSSQIGSCVSNADCSTQCDTACAGLGKVQWGSGCENFCQGGTRNNLACICDVFDGSGCVGGVAGVNDCPGGNCVGKNNEADQDCQCQCIDYAAGGASGPGTAQCNLSADIKVVASLPCSNPAVLDLPPICAPFSSQSTNGLTAPANEGTAGDIGIGTLIGASGTCTDFDASVTTGYTVVGDLGFFDTTIGDVRVPITIDCQ